jgi:methyltransferase FkbM-like protein
VTRIPFDDIILGAATVDLLKIDAEGSEYPILLTSRTLDRVREIVGEYHAVSEVPESQAIPGYPEWTIQNLGQHLVLNGFVVQICDKGLRGLFRAFRKADAKGWSVSASAPALRG